jgi:RimJ/RimL family protein N-acetyltransferase
MITTARLRLRPWREADKPAFAAATNTEAVMRHLGGVLAPEKSDAVIDGHMKLQAEQGMCFWAVETREDERLIGMCGLRHVSLPGTGLTDELEIGWRLAEAEWGKGYAREAAAACIEWGWRNTPRPRIAAWTIPANTPSWGLMIRLGMTHRPDLDFEHPRFPVGHPLSRHVVYVIDRPPGL